MAACHPFGQGPFGGGAFGGCEQVAIHPDCGFGNEPFGWGPFGQGCTPKFVVKDVKVVAAYDGPQMVLSWTAPIAPESVSRLRILRKEREYPKSTTDADAVLVFDTTDMSIVKFADTTRNPDKLGAVPAAGTVYYYRIFTETSEVQELTDALGTSEGFDYCYSADAHDLSYVAGKFDDALWYDLLPDSWRMEDIRTSKQTLEVYTDPATEERVGLIDASEPEGFTRRFVRIWTLLFLRAYAHARTIRDVWDVWSVRADVLRHLAEVLQVRIDERQTFNVWRRDMLDAVSTHRKKGSKHLLDTVAEQITGQVPTSVQMVVRIHSAWNPQSPDDEMSPGLIIGANADKVDAKDDPNTYCWNPSMESSYNERGWRLYFDVALTEDARTRLTDALRELKPAVVTAEVWEAGVMTVKEI